MKRNFLKVIAVLAVVVMVSAQCVVGIAASVKKPKINKTLAMMPVGYSCKLYLKNKPKNGVVKWKSKNKKIATVTKKGKVTGKKVGKTKVFCIVKIGRKKVKLVCKISVLKSSSKNTQPTATATAKVTNIATVTATAKMTSAPTASAKATNTTASATAKATNTTAATAKATATNTATARATVKVNVGNASVALGMGIAEVKNVLGDAAYTIASEYEGCVWHVYNSDYKQLTIILVKNNEVVGVYADGKQFSYDNVNTNVTGELLTENGFSTDRYKETYTKRESDITINVYMDVLGDKTAEGILVMRKITFAINADTYSTFEKISFELTNAFRAKNDLPTLKSNNNVANVARNHSEDMSGKKYFDHVTPDGKNPGDRLKNAGLNFMAYAENIAMGYEDAFEVTYGWINSSGHRSNMLFDAVTDIGVGIDSSCTYYTQLYYRGA